MSMAAVWLRVGNFVVGFGAATFSAYQMIVVPLERRHQQHLEQLQASESKVTAQIAALDARLRKLEINE
jgi:type II secretory pathway component PulM